MSVSRSVVVSSAVSVGLLACAAVSAVALVNVTAASADENQGDFAILAEPAVTPDLLPAASGVLPAVPTVPELPVVPSVPASSGAEPVASVPSVGSAPQSAGTEPVAAPQKRPVTAQPSLAASAAPSGSGVSVTSSPRPTFSKAAAVQVVQGLTPGEVTGVESVRQAGLDAWAVTVSRPDGSVVVGYVDVVSGTVFDWAVVREAPVPQVPLPEAAVPDSSFGTDPSLTAPLFESDDWDEKEDESEEHEEEHDEGEERYEDD